FRNENLPVLRLRRLLDIPTNGQKFHSVIVVKINNEKYGLLVDNILAQEDVIVKPLDPLVQLRMFSGVSIYHDGRPNLILEPKGLE
ncbi:MAG: chemotaxis protein CheW, partial [candidate division WOR-3 bacterium]